MSEAVLAIPEVEEDGTDAIALPTLSTEQTAKLLAPKAPLLEHQKSFISAEPSLPTGVIIPPIKSGAAANKLSSTKDLHTKDSKTPAAAPPNLIIDVSTMMKLNIIQVLSRFFVCKLQQLMLHTKLVNIALKL